MSDFNAPKLVIPIVPLPIIVPLPLTTIVIVAHIPLASAYLALIQHVYGQLPSAVYAVDVPANAAPTGIAQQINHLLGDNTGLIFTDLLGATPHNCATKACEQSNNRYFISPISAPLLLRALNYRHLPLDDLYHKLLNNL